MPKGQTKFAQCVRAVSRSGSADDPRAVCGAMRAKTKRNDLFGISPDQYRASIESLQRDLKFARRDLRPPERGRVIKEIRQGISELKRELKKAIAHDKKNAPRRRSNKGRRNPLDGAEARYESFHGRPSEEIVEVSTRVHEHSVLSGIGDLVKLIVITEDGHKVVISKLEDRDGNPALLAQNEAATQLYIEGGDQSVRLSDFGIYEPYHESETLGRVRNVYYFTTKDHLGNEGGTAIYNHKFGGIREVEIRGKTRRKRSPLPFLVYDVRNRLLSFSGGGYTIPDEGIAN